VEFIDTISKCINLSTPGPDHISWSYLKTLIKNNKCISNIVNITNLCINLSYWLSHFKKSISIIILKPNRSLYNTSKTFQPIVLLNMVGKLIRKFISNKIQVYSITSNFIYLTPIGGIKQWSTIDTRVFLTHLICMGWVRDLYMSTLAFDVAQFFPSLNYQLLLIILNKASFDSYISFFFSNYLINRQTQYI